MNDLHYSLRAVSSMRGAAVIAILTLALGIAATTTMFSAVDATLLRLVPFADPDRLVLLFTVRTTPTEGAIQSRWSKSVLDLVTRSAHSFESIASYSGPLVSISGGEGDPEQIDGELVSPGYFEILRVAPAAGRTFTPDEDRAAGAAPVAILSDGLWRRRYAADPAMLGKTVRINDVPLTVVGIMPAGFRGLTDRSQIWIPRTMAPRLTYADYLTTPQLFMPAVARLKRDVTLEHANQELAALSRSFPLPQNAPDATWTAIAERASDARVDPAQRRSVVLLLAAAACVLLITCANIASLLLARARLRAREIAIRLAIGSSRRRLMRQLLTESLVLSGAAGACGILVAPWGVNLFARYAPSILWTGRTTMGAFSSPELDVRALVFAIALTAVTTVLCGLAPAFTSSRAEMTTALKEDARSGGSRRGVFRLLVVAEIAAAVMLLAGAGLLLDSFIRLQGLRQGFTSDGVLTFWVRPPVSRYTNAQGPAIIERLLTSVQRVPGVESAAVNRCTPFTGCARTNLFFTDRPNDPEIPPTVGRHYVSADYFKTLGIPLIAGRALRDDDRPGRPAVTVINESAAHRFWPGENAIGKRVWFGTTTGPFADASHPVEIVGVVGDVKYEAADWPNSIGRPEFYTSYLQFAYPDTMVIVKTRGPMSALVPALRHAVAAVDSSLPIYDVLTLDERVALALSRPRFNAELVAAFALMALVVASLGIYGMMSFSVATRLRELGVRLALGAEPSRIVRLVLGEGLRLACVGGAVGIAAALAAGRLLQSVVIGVAPSDPRVLVAVVVAMLAATALAAFVPARRASAVDPIVVLRQE
jgi:putative ABC transport system permease protein